MSNIRNFMIFVFVTFGISFSVAYADDTLKIEEHEGVKFTPLSDTIWMHTSYKLVPGFGNILTNGLVVLVGDKDILLVDTAWTDKETETVLNWVENKFQRSVSYAIFTHAHSDKMGGVGAINARGIKSYASQLSNEIAPTKGLVPASFDLKLEKGNVFQFLPGINVLYPGAAHTKDNIVVYVENEALLFGGCMIRPTGATNLGYTSDGDVANWADAVKLVENAFSKAQHIIPSHGAPSDRSILEHTHMLADKAVEKLSEHNSQ